MPKGVTLVGTKILLECMYIWPKEIVIIKYSSLVEWLYIYLLTCNTYAFTNSESILAFAVNF